MATRTLEVNITGDPSRFNRSLGQVDTSVDQSTKRMHRLGTVGKAAFSGLALAAGAAAAVGLKQAATAAIEAEKTQARLEAQLKASGIAYKQHGDRIDEVIGKVSRLSGLDDEDLTDSFTNIVRVTGDVNKSLRLTGLAADFARAKHMDVAKAGELVGKVAGGNTGILGRYGIKIKEGATATEALGELQKKFSGQAKAYGDTTQGAVDKASVAWENLMEVLGEKLAPVIRKAADILTSLFDTQSKGNKVIRRAADAYLDYLATVRDVVRKAVRAVENWVDKNREQINDVIRAFRRVGNFIKDIVTDVIIPVIKRIAPIVQAFVERSLHFISNLVRVVTSLINGDWAKAWDAFKDLVKDAITDTLNIVRQMIKAIGGILGRVATAAKKAAVNIGKEIVGGIVDGIKAAGKSAGGGIAGAIKGLLPSGKSFGLPIGDSIAGAMPRGVPGLGGVKFGGDLHGANAFMAGPASIASKFGLQITSGKDDHSKYTASGNISNHYSGNAIDVSNGYAPTPQMMAFAKFMVANYGSQLAELIYTPLGFSIDNGQRTAPIAASDHYNHVHVALNGPLGGGRKGDGRGRRADISGLRPGRGRDPRSGDVIGAKGAARAAYAAGFRGNDLVHMVAIAGRESGYDTDATNFVYPDHSVGLWQINQLAHKGRYGSDAQLMNPVTNAKAAMALFRAGGLTPWAHAGGPLGDTNVAAARAVVYALGKAGLRSGGSPGAGGGGGGTADPSSGRGGSMGPNRSGGFGDLGGGKGQGPGRGGGGGGDGGETVSSFDMALARVGVRTARAERKDDLGGLIKAMVQERKIKRRRLRLIKRVLRGRIRNRARKQRLLQEQAQLISEIGDLTEGIKEFKADQAGGATTISRAEELDAGVDPDAAAAADTGGAGGGGVSDAAAEAQAARDAVAEEMRNLVAQQVQNQEDIKRLMQTQQPQLMAALAAVVSGEIGGKVGLGFQGGGYYPGSTARY